MKKIISYFQKLFLKSSCCYVIEQNLYHSEFKIIGFKKTLQQAEQFCQKNKAQYREYRFFQIKELK